MRPTRSRSLLVLLLVPLLALVGCGDDEDEADGDAASAPLEGPTEFCSAVTDLNVRTPQAFTGSGEQLESLEEMAASAPEEVAEDVETWLEWAREQAEQSSPDDTVEEFPPDVEDAVFNVSAYEDENCG